jgi:Protein of unknown function (DUF3034)
LAHWPTPCRRFFARAELDRAYDDRPSGCVPEELWTAVGILYKDLDAGGRSPTLTALGADDHGADFYVSATKLYLARGLLVNATDARAAGADAPRQHHEIRTGVPSEPSIACRVASFGAVAMQVADVPADFRVPSVRRA